MTKTSSYGAGASGVGPVGPGGASIRLFFFYFQRKTKTQRRNLSPVFEETLEYFLPAGEVRRKRLEVSVFHDSRYAHLQNLLSSSHDYSVECTKMEIDLREIEHTCV